MSSPTKFALDIAQFVEKAKAAPEQVVRKVSQDVLTSVVLKTPVDTGRARANWNVSLNRVDPSVTYTLTDKDGSTTIVQGLAAINQWKPGDDVVIASNLPYIIPLEYGHSKQAPHGMVRLTVAEFQTFINRAVGSVAAAS